MIRIGKRTCLLLPLLALAAPSQASDWRMFTRSAEAHGATVDFIDLEGILVKGDSRTVWITAITNDRTIPFEEARNKVEFDCANARLHLLSGIVTYWAGNSETFPDMMSTWRPITPGTKFDAMHALVCTGQGKEKALPIQGTPLKAGRSYLKSLK